jgi:hypothetical protein
MSDVQSIMTPVGRLVAGSVNEPFPMTDDNNQPKLDSSGQQKHEYYVGLAIPKNGTGQHWAHTSWGAILWVAGHGAFPGGQAQKDSFAWKVTDGDSMEPNTKNVRPCDREGWPGNWIVGFKTGFAPQMVNHDGKQAIAGQEFYRGCYVQVEATVNGNASTQSPGIYLNHRIIALSGHGERMTTGPDAASVGFGGAPAPAGMSATPLAQNVAANVPQQAPAPVQQMAPAPVQQMAPAPVQQMAPAPVQQMAPAPVQQMAPAPVAQQPMQAPAPVQQMAPTQPHPQVMTPPPPVQQ